MPKFNLTQKRMVTEKGTATVDIPEGVVPLQWLEEQRAKGNEPLTFEEEYVSYLSGEVEPVHEEPPETEEPEPEAEQTEDEDADEPLDADK